MASKIAVVTGASAGVGRASAIEFGRHGWRVALLARGNDGLRGAKYEVEQAGGQAMIIPTDVADYDQVEAAAERVEREWGPMDVWVNNAMATIFCEMVSISPADYKRATEVTYLGAVWGTMVALKRMKERNAGTIVQVGSALAYRSIPLQAPYCGAKAGIRGFTDSLRSELIHNKSRVHVTMVHLSAFNTPQFDWGRTCMRFKPKPLGKIFQPEIAAQGIYWAATHRRRELWLGFPAVEAILGTRVMPGFLDHMLANNAYSGQQSNEPISPSHQDNLYNPVPGDFGVHGRFDERATLSSSELWLTTHRWSLVAGAIILAIVAAEVPALVHRIRVRK